MVLFTPTGAQVVDLIVFSIVFCCIVLYRVVLCRVVLSCAVLSCAVLYLIGFSFIALYFTIFCCVDTLCCVGLYFVLLYQIVSECSASYLSFCVVLYCFVAAKMI